MYVARVRALTHAVDPAGEIRIHHVVEMYVARVRALTRFLNIVLDFIACPVEMYVARVRALTQLPIK